MFFVKDYPLLDSISRQEQQQRKIHTIYEKLEKQTKAK